MTLVEEDRERVGHPQSDQIGDLLGCRQDALRRARSARSRWRATASALPASARPTPLIPRAGKITLHRSAAANENMVVFCRPPIVGGNAPDDAVPPGSLVRS
jgi:hypothetical protein